MYFLHVYSFLYNLDIHYLHLYTLEVVATIFKNDGSFGWWYKPILKEIDGETRKRTTYGVWMWPVAGAVKHSTLFWPVVSITFFCSPLKIGEDEPNLTHIFQMGWFIHQLVLKQNLQTKVNFRDFWDLRFQNLSFVPYMRQYKLSRWCFQMVFSNFTPNLGEMIHFDSYVSSWLKPLRV